MRSAAACSQRKLPGGSGLTTASRSQEAAGPAALESLLLTEESLAFKLPTQDAVTLQVSTVRTCEED